MHYDKLGEFRFHPISYKRTSIKRNLTEYRFVLKALKLFFIKKYRFEVEYLYLTRSTRVWKRSLSEYLQKQK